MIAAGLAERVRRRLSEDAVLAGGEGASLPAVRAAVARAVRDEGVLLPPAALGDLVREVTDELSGLGAVQPLLRDPAVTDVMVNGPDEVWVERDGRLERTAVRFADADAIRTAVLRVVGPLGLRLDRSRPYVDARLADGSRLHAVLPPLSAGSPVVTIRRFPSVSQDWDDLQSSGSLLPAAVTLLRQAVAQRRAIVVAGRTGTGKTTLLNVLLGDVCAAERVVVIEDAPELRPRCPHIVRLEARPANAEGAGEITIRDLVRQSLRMRPDRIVVGEVRGVEISDVLQALATGHEGCMTTVHAKAADEALVRLEGMALQAGLPLEAARAQLAVGLDLVVVCSRGPDGQRGVTQIAQLERRDGGALRTRDLWRRGRWG